jgi:hypothetical protein
MKRITLISLFRIKVQVSYSQTVSQYAVESPSKKLIAAVLIRFETN